jgi:hypothetical protein
MLTYRQSAKTCIFGSPETHNTHPIIGYYNVNKKVLGLDIGARFVVGFFLDEIPQPPYPNWYRKHGKKNIYKISFSNKKKKSEGEEASNTADLSQAVELLTRLKPDVIVLEPTGVWYSSIWVKLAEHLGIEVRWIGHQDLHHNRGNYGFRDKDDRTDAFCLALSYHDPAFAESRWLKGKLLIAAELHNRLLQLKGIDRTRIAQMNQLKQRLKLEFPEIANRKPTQKCKAGYTAWIGWLAGIHQYSLIENEYKRSIVHTLGIEISQYTREHAEAIAIAQQRIVRIEQEMLYFLESEEIAPYKRVFDRMGFGVRTAAAVLGAVYPIEKFMVDGKERVERWEDDRGKYKRNRSRSAFQMSMGMGKRLIESGSSTVYRFGGSGLVRVQLYCWVHKEIFSKPTANSWLHKELDRKAMIPQHENQKQARPLTIETLYWGWKKTKGGKQAKHKASVKAVITLAYRVTKILYEELSKEVLGI